MGVDPHPLLGLHKSAAESGKIAYARAADIHGTVDCR